jgi:NADH-quinone oxidoreductase subunit L
MFSPVDYVWVIPALPLAAMLVIFCITRPLATLAKQRATPPSHTTGSVAHESHGGHTDASHGAPAAAEEDDDHGMGHAHGGPTPFWDMVGSLIGVACLAASLLWSVLILFQFLGDSALLANGKTETLYTWFTFGSLNYTIDFRVDTLTVVMLIVVTGVSAVVHLFSIGYMAGDRGYSRFFIELTLFTLAMLILVLAANFLVIFIGWELVGLSSYLLIGFWYYHRPPPPGSEMPYPPPAQVKAFVTTRLGDFGFMIGILILFTQTGTFNFVQLNTAVQGLDKATLTIAMILVFAGAVGKSAQFPLHVWLPDAMAGPTPVSALIHAATMVAAGVYLVARLFPLYAAADPLAFQIVGYIGAFTALFAATIALTQNDIKGVLAYSTISQLGYMFTGLAVADTNTIGMYHLFTHAFFKALLFLGAGSVIHAVTVQDMRQMGGLAKALPVTALTMLTATLAISGIPPFSGFWSKDPIISTAYDKGDYVLYAFTLFTALLTAFYMFRLYFLTFGGRGGALAGFWGGPAQYRGEGHPHESPVWMTLPLVILASATVVFGLLGFVGFNQGFAWFLNGGQNVSFAISPPLDTMTLIGVGMGVAGILIAWLMYGVSVVPANVLTANPVGGFVHRVLYNRYYINELYGWIIKWVVYGLAGFAAAFDHYVIDGIVNGSARAVRSMGAGLRRTESGRVQSYGAALFGGALIILLVIFFATGIIGK